MSPDDEADHSEPEALVCQAGPYPVYAGRGTAAFVGNRWLGATNSILQRTLERIETVIKSMM